MHTSASLQSQHIRAIVLQLLGESLIRFYLTELRECRALRIRERAGTDESEDLADGPSFGHARAGSGKADRPAALRDPDAGAPAPAEY